MNILYEDNHLLIVNKPPNLPTQESSHHTLSLTSLAKEWVKNTYKKPGEVFLEPIHRLDKVVSGIVVFARTSKALSRLQEALRQHQIKKTYFAWIEGKLSAAGKLENYLFHDDFQARIVKAAYPGAKLSTLHYTPLSIHAHNTYVEIELNTGRYHQIRAQFAHIRHPIIGDFKYGSPKRYEDQRIDLHHGKISFEHPVQKKDLFFECPPLFTPKLF